MLFIDRGNSELLAAKLKNQLGLLAVVAARTYLEPPEEVYRIFKDVFFNYLLNGESIKDSFEQARSVVTASSKK